MQSPGEVALCRQGHLADLCNGCIPANFTSEEFYYWMLEAGCGYPVQVGGYADDNIDFLLDTVYPRVKAKVAKDSNHQSDLTSDREKTMITGYSLGGLISCYAAWTRPQVCL